MSNINLKMMKTRNLLKLFFTAVAVMFVSAMFAQTNENEPWEDMVTGSGENDSVVVNSTVPYYVEPDPVLNNLNGQYDPTSTNADQNINSTFEWRSSDNTVGFNDPTGGASAPYREVTFPGTATDGITIEVRELSSSGCSDGNWASKTVDVIPAPDFTTDAIHNLEVCSGTEHTVSIESIADDGIDGTSKYYFLLDIDKRVREASETSPNYQNIYTHADTVVQVNTTDVTSGGVGLITQTFTAGNYDYNGDGTAEKCITEYRFDFTENLGGDDVAGLNNHISRKGGFLDLSNDGTSPEGKTPIDFSSGYDNTNYGYGASYNAETLYSWYGQDAGTITVTVYPAPNTGNIYHVPNNFEQ